MPRRRVPPSSPILVQTGRQIYLAKDRETGELLGEVHRYVGGWYAYPMNADEPIGHCGKRSAAAELLVKHRSGH